MLTHTYYAQNYAGIIYLPLVTIINDVRVEHKLHNVMYIMCTVRARVFVSACVHVFYLCLRMWPYHNNNIIYWYRIRSN